MALNSAPISLAETQLYLLKLLGRYPEDDYAKLISTLDPNELTDSYQIDKDNTGGNWDIRIKKLENKVALIFAGWDGTKRIGTQSPNKYATQLYLPLVSYLIHLLLNTWHSPDYDLINEIIQAYVDTGLNYDISITALDYDKLMEHFTDYEYADVFVKTDMYQPLFNQVEEFDDDLDVPQEDAEEEEEEDAEEEEEEDADVDAEEDLDAEEEEAMVITEETSYPPYSKCSEALDYVSQVEWTEESPTVFINLLNPNGIGRFNCYNGENLRTWLKNPVNTFAKWVQNPEANPMDEMGHGGKPDRNSKYYKLYEGNFLVDDKLSRQLKKQDMIIADAQYQGLERIGNLNPRATLMVSALHGQAPGVPVYKVIKITKVKPASPKKSPVKSPKRKSPSPAKVRVLTAAERARLRGPPPPRPPSPEPE